MASGRHEPCHDREFEEQDSDFDIVGRGFTDSRAEYERPRKRGTLDVVRIREMEAVNRGYQSGQRGENGRTRKGDYVQEQRVLDGGRVREGEAVNGGYPSDYSERNSIRRKGRESAELSIESGDVLGRGITDLSDEYGTNRKVYERGVQDGVRVGGREAVNDGYHLGSSGTRKGRELGKPLTEHGDLKSPGTQSESPKLENGNKLLVESKKRKFTPIVWDRDDKEVSTSSKIRASPSIGLPPPPPRPKIYHKSPNIVSDGCVQISSVKDNNDDSQSSKPYLDKLLVAVEVETHISPLSDWPLDVASPPQKEKGDNYPEKELVDNQDNFTSVNILSSRWAGDADSPPDEGEIADDGDIGTSRKVSITRLAETSRRNKSLTPEYQDLKRERLERNMRRLSGSDDEGGYYRSTSIDVYSSDNMEKNEDEHGKNEDSATLSPTDSDDESVKKCMPESEPAAQRSIGMLEGCRSVDEYERLNRINEGAYGVVYRAKDKKTGDIVALKKVKMEKEREGFPLTALREINILLSFHHPSIVDVKEVVMGNNLDNIFMVMEYMEHDVKALMEAMKQPFSQSEVKCLMLQLLGGVKYLHDNWVLHRDLKTSNLLMNNRGELKICDFGLARQYGSPLKPYTHLVVTLWYRAPELLLGQKEYSTAIDMWSVGCIMAELLSKEPLFKGEKELDQLDKIFRMLGTPNETIWPGFSKLPGVKVNFVKHQYNQLRKKFRATTFTGSPVLSDSGLDLLNKLLTYDPDKRMTADDALNHEWFHEVPLPKTKEFMPTFPAQNAQDRRFRRVKKSPDPLEEQFRKELKKGGLGTGGLFE